MATLNKVQLIGYLGDEPKVERLQSGNVRATLSVATTDRGYTTKSGSVIPDKTEWHSVVFWGNLAELCEKYLHKSSCVYVEGKLRTRSWEDQNGIVHYRVEIEGNQLQMLDKKPTESSISSDVSRAQDGAKNGQERQAQSPPPPPSDDNSDDLPF